MEKIKETGLKFCPKDHPQGLVVGLSENGEAICVPHGEESRNENVMVFGPAGSGKTFAFTKPNLLACIDQGFSAVVSDPSGELFSATYRMAVEKGICVRVLNAKSPDASDSWNCLASLEDPGEADALVTDTEDDYFALIEKNLFKCLVRYVAFSPNFSGEERNIGAVCDVLDEIIKNEGEYPFFDELFEMHPTDPAASAWKKYKNCGQKQKQAALFGVSEKMRIFRIDLLKKIVSYNEIDLSLPGRKQCIYYVISSFQDRSMTPIINMFFTMAFQALIQEAEKNPDGKLKVPTMFILDEFKAIGKISRLSDIMANKCGISVSILIQDYMQLERTYKDESRDILSGCDTWVVLDINDPETAEIISDRPECAKNELQYFMELHRKNKILIIPRECDIVEAERYGFIHHCLAEKVNRDSQIPDTDYVPERQNCR